MIRLALLATALLVPDMALAHGGLPGGGGFYSGAAHPFVAIEQLLALIVLGLLLGQQPGAFSRIPLAGLALGLAVGLALGVGLTAIAPPGFGSGATPFAALLFGGALALARPVAPWALTLSGVLSGCVIGIDTDSPAAISGGVIDSVTPYAGVFTGVFLIVLNAAALAHVARNPPWSYGVRVAGSWVVAIAVMVLALRFRATVPL